MDMNEVLKNIKIDDLGVNDQNRQQGSVLLDYFKTLMRRKWLILLCTMTVVLPATIWMLLVNPTYEAEASIIYEEANDTAFLLDIGQSMYNKSAIINMIEQVKSRTLAQQVAESLPEDIKKTFELPKERDANFSRDTFIGKIIKDNLQIQTVRGADVLKISLQAHDPNAARVITNTYVDQIINWNIQKNRNQISSIRSFVENQLQVFQDRLKASEEALLEFKEKNDLVILSDASSEVLTNLTEAETAYNQIKAEREALEQRQSYLERKKQELLPSVSLTNSEMAQQLKEDLVTLEQQHSILKAQNNPATGSQMAEIRDQINRTKQALIDELMRNSIRDNLMDPLSQIRTLLQELITVQVDLETMKAREQGLKRTVDKYNGELQLLPKQELELARLIRAQDVNNNVYANLLEKREEARITEAGKVGDVRVIDYAETPFAPIKPQKKKTVGLALVLGLLLGIGSAFLLNTLDNSLRSEQDIEKYLSLPVLASIPKISTNGVLHRIKKTEDVNNGYSSKLLSEVLIKSPVVEAYRTLQLNFSFFNPDKEFKKVLITSSAPGEGKTLTSINIAQLYAREGTKTLLIDCDLRRPMIHNALNIPQEPGLTNALVNRIEDWETYIQKCHYENLFILTSGALPPNPSELLRSQKMATLLKQLEDEYQLLVFDGPPVISVTDSLILGQKIDGALLVLRSGKVHRDAAQKAKKLLETGNINIVGALLNDVDFKNTYGYYKDYYYYSHKKKTTTQSV